MKVLCVHKKIKSIVGCVIMLFFFISCASTDVQPSIPHTAESLNAQDYLIGAEDVVEVMVWKNADLSRTTNVRPDGKISLPLIGDVQAAGLTAEHLRDVIAEKLKSYYKEPPQISVNDKIL